MRGARRLQSSADRSANAAFGAARGDRRRARSSTMAPNCASLVVVACLAPAAALHSAFGSAPRVHRPRSRPPLAVASSGGDRRSALLGFSAALAGSLSLAAPASAAATPWPYSTLIEEIDRRGVQSVLLSADGKQVVAIDKKAFSKLTPADQKVVREVVGEASRRLDEENRLGEANAREALQNQGIEFVTANSDAEVERWYQISDEATQRLLEQNIYSLEPFHLL